jgi:hypothetical protein
MLSGSSCTEYLVSQRPDVAFLRTGEADPFSEKGAIRSEGMAMALCKGTEGDYTRGLIEVEKMTDLLKLQ